MKQRIIKLESLFAQQDQVIETLNQELFRQQQEMDRLKQRIVVLSEKLSSFESSEEIAGNEKPPHY
jgi:SlyX protein